MKKLRILVATLGAALAIGAFPAPAQATHVCIFWDDGRFGLVGEWLHHADCNHNVQVTWLLCELVGLTCSE